MGALVISNSPTDEMVGDVALLPPEIRRYSAYHTERLLWLIGSGDILVLPVPPGPDYVRYVAGLIGVDPSSFSVVVPPPGRLGVDVLSRDRLLSETFLRELSTLLGWHPIDRIIPYHFDTSVAHLVAALGLERAAPGLRFVQEGGARLLSSKVTFRALAAGIGMATAEGAVAADREQAERCIWRLLDDGCPVIVKQEFNTGCRGNAILSPSDATAAIGAPRVYMVREHASLAKHLADNWSWYSDGGRHRVVIERYLPDCTTIYSELLVDERTIDLVGHGEVRMRPTIDGVIVPSSLSELGAFPEFLGASRRLCELLQMMGYRGNVSVDAIVTPGGEIVVTEFNARAGGSTHVHAICDRVVGGDHAVDRVLVERRGCVLPSLTDALTGLRHAGIAYMPERRSGVVISVEGRGSEAVADCCVVGESRAHAMDLERRLEACLPALVD